MRWPASDWSGGGKLRVLTPHPGEMARLTGKKIAEIQADRVGAARGLATARTGLPGAERRAHA